MKSLIREFLAEAEDLSLSAEPVSVAPPGGNPMSDADFPAAPPTPAPGAGSSPVMPTPSGNGSNTIQKNVIDKEVIKAITIPLKSLVSAFEKIFDSNDFTPEQAKPHIDRFLETLATFADGLSKVGGQEPAPEASPMPEAPAPEATMPLNNQEPPVAPEGGMEGLGNSAEGTPEGGQGYTNPWGGYENSETEPTDFEGMGGQ